MWATTRWMRRSYSALLLPLSRGGEAFAIAAAPISGAAPTGRGAG